MSKFQVEVSRTIVVTVPVEAASPQAAVALVDDWHFTLPPRDSWSGQKDWRYVVYGDDGSGEPLLEVEQ